MASAPTEPNLGRKCYETLVKEQYPKAVVIKSNGLFSVMKRPDTKHVDDCFAVTKESELTAWELAARNLGLV